MSEPHSPRAHALAGALTLTVGAALPIQGDRPILSPGMLDRLASARTPDQWPLQLGQLFSLCGHAQTLAASLALQGAGQIQSGDLMTARTGYLLQVVTAGEQLQRLLLEWPLACPQPGVPPDLPLLKAVRSSTPPAGASTEELQRHLEVLATVLGDRLFGMRVSDWLARWLAQPAPWLDRWTLGNDGTVARWLRAVRPLASAVRLKHRPLPSPETDAAGFRALGMRLLHDPAQSQRPMWQGQPAETGPCSRAWLGGSFVPDDTLWLRLGARLADLAAVLSRPGSLRFGALRLGPGAGLGWCEMSRGLLVHAVQCEQVAPDAAHTIARYRLQAPTEWNFHPDGPLADWLRMAPPSDERLTQARLAAAALDPCVVLHVRSAADATQTR